MADKQDSDQGKKAVVVGQRQLLFFGQGTDDGKGRAIKPPTPDAIRVLLDRSIPDCPFFGYIGNDQAVEKLLDVIFEAHTKPNHNAGPNGLALIGPASTGKTTLARMLARGLGTSILGDDEYRHGVFPIIECDRSIKNTGDLLVRLKETLKQSGIPLVAQAGTGVQLYKSPPAVIYFDEAQALKGDWLLKATEREDATLITDDAVVDCKNVLWIISTTHRGKLPKAFDTRFSKVFLEPYTLQEVTIMVQNRNTDLPEDVCRLIASYGGRVPREALDFAGEVKKAAFRLGTTDWKKVCKVVGARNNVDEEGLNRQHLQVLVALCNNKNRARQRVPMSLKQLADQVNIEEEDLEEYVLPPLQVTTADHLPLIRTTSRGRELTEDGIHALVRRNIIQRIGPTAGSATVPTNK